MDWIAALKIAVSVTSVLSLAAFVSALYLRLAAHRGERSLREIVEGEDVVRHEQVVNILKTFSSDEQRLEALRAILGSQDEKFRRILRKVRNEVDIAMRRWRRKHLKARAAAQLLHVAGEPPCRARR